MSKFFRILMLIGFAIPAMAQLDPQFTHYSFTSQYINPAYAGSRGVIALNALSRLQWTSFDGAPTQFAVGAHAPVGKTSSIQKVAVGVQAFGEEIGARRNIGLNLQYAYRIPISRVGVLSLGLQAGFSSYSFDVNKVSSTSQIFSTSFNTFSPNLGVGAFFYSPRYFIGVSVPKIIENNISNTTSDAATDEAREDRNYYATVGAVLPATDDIVLKPSVIFKISEQGRSDFETQINAFYLQRYSVGLGYRYEEAVSFLAEMQITQALRVGYSYDLGITELANSHDGSHEVVLGFDFGVNVNSLTTPRFIRYF